MKRLILFCLLALAGCFAARAQQYSIDWYKVAGGGGTSTGGTYPVSGTIGQHDAGGPMTGGNYSLTGGFWALISVVQTPGAPTLYISHSGNTVTVFWQNVSGWSLQQNNNLADAGRLVGQQQLDDLQRHKLSEPHFADGESVLPLEQSLRGVHAKTPLQAAQWLFEVAFILTISLILRISRPLATVDVSTRHQLGLWGGLQPI